MSKESCVIITTINKPTESIFKHLSNPNCDVIVVGDIKTPDDYKNLHDDHVIKETELDILGKWLEYNFRNIKMFSHTINNPNNLIVFIFCFLI